MKKYVIYVFVLFSFIIINYVSVAEWQKDGELEWLNVSNSAIKQYVFSQDGKSIYVLDSSNVFFKYDIETGKMLWIKNLTSARYGNAKFQGARIGEDAVQYLVWFGGDNYKNYIQLRDIEADNIIGAFQITSSINQLITFLFDRGFTFIFNSAYIYFSEYVHYIESAGPQTYEKATGVLNFYKVQNDSILFTRNLKDKYPLSYYFNKNSGTLVGSYRYYYYLQSAIFPYDIKVLVNNWTYLYDFQNDSLRLLNNSAYSTLILSNDGKYLIAHDKHKLFVYDLKTFKQIRSINYSDTIHSSTPFNNDNFILISNGKSIRIHNLTNLDPIDTLIFPTLETSIKNLTYSPDDKGIYFSSGPNIYRYNLDIQNHYIKAFFYNDTTIIEVNEPIHFYDASTKNAKTFLWEFGDGTTSKEENPTHKYSDTGYFDVELIVSNNERIDSFKIEKCVYILPELIADFDYKITMSVFPVKVEFINKSQGNIDSLEWNFDDYNKSTDYNPTHYYKVNDTFTVNLKVYSMQYIREASKQIIINSTQSELDLKEWKYETLYKDTTDMAAINGVELLDNKIVFLQDKDNTPYSINNAGDLLWHKVWDSTSGFTNLGKRSLLQRYPANNNYFLFGQDNLLALIDYDAEINKTYNIPNYKINDSTYRRNNLKCISIYNDTIILGTFTFFREGPIISEYTINIYEISYDFEFLTNTNIINHRSNDGISTLDIKMDILKSETGKIDYILRVYTKGYYYLGPYPTDENYTVWGDVLLKVNDTTLYHSYKEIRTSLIHIFDFVFKGEKYFIYNSFIRLNDNTLIVALQDTTVKFFNNQNKVTKDLKYPNMYFTSMITLDSANFLAAGSINDSPGYAIINEMGQVVKTVILSSRFGAFNSITITPDTNLLFSGYQFVDKELHRRPYFAKTNSQFIRERISKQMHVSSVDESQYDGNITIYPNPVTDALQISGINGYQIWSYSISNLLGQEIMKGDLTSNVISVSNLPKGIYFMVLRNQGKIIPMKFIKE